MEQRKQTAVEWLEELLHFECKYSLNNEVIINYDVLDNIIMKTKQMEKDQILRAYRSGEVGEIYELNPVRTLTAKQYYENNYGK